MDRHNKYKRQTAHQHWWATFRINSCFILHLTTAILNANLNQIAFPPPHLFHCQVECRVSATVWGAREHSRQGISFSGQLGVCRCQGHRQQESIWAGTLSNCVNTGVRQSHTYSHTLSIMKWPFHFMTLHYCLWMWLTVIPRCFLNALQHIEGNWKK